MLAGRAQVIYLATGAVPTADDPEWLARVATHQARRPASWHTIETADAAAVLAAGPGATDPRRAVLFDCVGTWLTAAMDAAGVWAAAEAGVDAAGVDAARVDAARVDAAMAADAALAQAQDDLVAAWTTTTAEVVTVTNEVGSGVVPATASGRRFRDELGRLNARLAAVADEVWLCTVGIPLRIR